MSGPESRSNHPSGGIGLDRSSGIANHILVEHCMTTGIPAARTGPRSGFSQRLRRGRGWSGYSRPMLDGQRDADSGKNYLSIRLVPIVRLYASIAASLGTLSSGPAAGGRCAFRVVVGDFELARPGIFKNLSHQVSDAVYCRLSILASTASPPRICTRRALLPPVTRPRLAAQLLRAPPLAALSSSILATRFLNSTYWHFS